MHIAGIDAVGYLRQIIHLGNDSACILDPTVTSARLVHPVMREPESGDGGTDAAHILGTGQGAGGGAVFNAAALGSLGTDARQMVGTINIYICQVEVFTSARSSVVPKSADE